MTRRLASLLAVASLAILLTGSPGSAHAAPGDLVLRKGPPPARGVREARVARGSFQTDTRASDAGAMPPGPAPFASLAQRRAAFPHEIYGPGFDPARSITSSSRRGKVDLFQRMRERAARASAFGPEGAPADIASVPGEDTVRVAMLRVDFLADRGGSASSGDGRFDLSPRDTLNRPLDPTPHNRKFFQAHADGIRRYYHDQMGGRVVLQFTVYPSAPDSAFHLSDMADYGPWKFSPEIYHAAVKLFHDALVAADTTETIAWSKFDRVCIIHAGSDLQSDVNADSPEDIPTFTIGVADSDAVALGPAKADTVFSSVIAPESIRQDGYEGTINAVLAHEFGHLVFGWRDVYDVQSGLPTVGYWSLMDVGNLVGNAVTLPNGTAVYATGILPPAVDPWQKRLVYDDMPAAPEPPYGSEVLLGDIEENYTVFKVPISGDEYLLLENRLDDINGNGSLTLARDPATGVILGPALSDTLEWDFLVPGPGTLVWHVDASVADFFGPRADPGFGLNVKRSRFGLQIIESDGLDDLGDFNSPFALGATTDPWSRDTASRLNDTTVPKLLTNSETDPHLDLEFTSSPGPLVSLRVTRQWDLPGWPAHVVQPPGGITPAISPLGPAPQVRIAWAGGDSAVHVRNADGSPMVPGAPNDIVFRAGGRLRPVAVVMRDASTGGPFLAACEDAPDTLLGGETGKLHLIHFTLDGHVASVQTVDQPAPVTAGPATQPPAVQIVVQPALSPAGVAPPPPPVFTGLSNGVVIRNEFSGTPGSEIATPVVMRTMRGRVTGLSASGVSCVAASDQGDLGLDDGSPALAIAPVGHALQPIGFTIATRRYVALVDRTVGGLRMFLRGAGSALDPVPLDQNLVLGERINAPAVDDVDGDGLPEIVFTTESGRVGYWNDNGSLSPGWPPRVEKEGFVTRAGPLPLTRPGASGVILTSLGNGVLTALDDRRKPAPGFPLGLSVGARGTGAIDNNNLPVDGPPALFIAGGDTLLYGILLVGLGANGRPATALWNHEGGAPGRGYTADRFFGVASTISQSPTAFLPGTFKCYPNPARQMPVTFAFRLREAGPVTIKIYDPAARQVDAITRDAAASDNAIVWDPGAHPSGLYLARVEAGGQVLTQPFAIVR